MRLYRLNPLSPPESLDPSWAAWLAGDNSPTVWIPRLTQLPLTLQILDICTTVTATEVSAAGIGLIPGPHLRREVWLGTVLAPKLVYACSWWNLQAAAHYLVDPSLPIWTSLAHFPQPLRREVRQLHQGHCDILATQFASQAVLTGRDYIFWHQQQPITCIYEVFSPQFQQAMATVIAGT